MKKRELVSSPLSVIYLLKYQYPRIGFFPPLLDLIFSATLFILRVLASISCFSWRVIFPKVYLLRLSRKAFTSATVISGCAKSLGIPKENVFIMQSGEVLELCDDYAKVVDKVHTGAILVDGLGVGDVGNIVLRDRQHLAEDGIIIVVLTLERRTNRLLAGPDIVSRGFVYVRESEELMDDARKAVSEALEKCLKGRHTDWNKIKLVIHDAMNDYIWKKTKRRPMVIPIIMDVDV